MATVDIIIPAFNAAKYLPLSLESVASQTFDDWQILLVDDGSSDNTAEVAAPFLKRFGPKIKYIKQSNQGVSAARNNAIRSSTSEFIAFLDADDVWLPCRLAESVNVLRTRPTVGLSYGLLTGIDHEGRHGGTFEGNGRHAEGRIAPYIYMRTIELPSPTITIRRDCLDEVGVFDETLRVTEDRDLWLRIALRYEVGFVPKVLALYRQSPNSLSTDPERMLQAQLQFIEKHYGSDGCGLMNRQASLARSYKQRAEVFMQQNKPRAALSSSLYALALYPIGLDNVRTAGSIFLSWMGGRNKSDF